MIDGEKSSEDVKKSQKIAKSVQKKKLRQSKKKKKIGPIWGEMTSDEKKTTETYIPKPILVSERKKIFFHLSRIFRDNSKMAKIQKKN